MTFHQKNLTIILNDLYKVDPSLKEHEPELIKLINELIKSKPAAELDEHFRKQLRDEILKMAKEIKLGAKVDKKDFPWGLALVSQFLKPVGYAVVGAAILALIVVPVMWNRQKLNLESSFAFQETETEENAFGKLAFNGAGTQGEEALGRGGGGVGGAVAVEVPVAEESVVAAKPPIAPITIPVMEKINYVYTYKGEDFTVDEVKAKVFQKVEDSGGSSALAAYFSKMKFVGLDLSKFRNTKLQYFAITEDRDHGYTLNMNLAKGVLSVNQNWERWNQENLTPLTVSDIPEDASIIAAANKFIGDYGIDTTPYGQPEVQKDWLQVLERMGGDYVPSTINITYPLVVEGKVVYERYGGKVGLNMSVDVRRIQVANLWNLTTQNYKSSLYETETDVNRILELAEKGSNRHSFDNPDKTLEFELGTPEMIYVRIINHGEKQAKEFLAPALLFSVTKAPSEVEYYQKNIIVPLVKEMLEQELNPPMPRQVMPLPEGN